MQICEIYSKITHYSKTINEKQDKNDQKVFREKKIIQRNAKVAVRSKKSLDFLRVQNPHNRIFHALAIVYLISRPENYESYLNLLKIFCSTILLRQINTK